jgi:carbamoyltransferase
VNILGINSFFEHPAVALVCDGELVFAMEDERLTRVKHGKSYTPYRTYVPYDSIYAALRSRGLCTRDLDEISYSYSRWLHLRSMGGCFTGQRLSSWREEMAAFRSAASVRSVWASAYEMPQRYRNVLVPDEVKSVAYREWNHHLCHAASAFFCSGYARSLVVVSDGSGENACTSVYVGRAKQLTKITEIGLPNSLGLFYSFITSHLGFEPFSDEYKVMGLAAYGERRFEREMAELVMLEPHGRYRVNMAKLRTLETILGPRRNTGAQLEQMHSDIARSAQDMLERAVEHIVTHHLQITGETNLCLAGGTFLNCVVNGRLGRLSGVKDIFVQPAAHDAGTAVGAAALSWVRRGGTPQLKYSSMFLGTKYDDKRIEAALKQAGACYTQLDDTTAVTLVAKLLAEEKIVAVFRNRIEFGPRALGSRSILASPRSERTREKLNDLKGREQFRPLAPLVTAEAFSKFFEGVANRYMMFTVTVRPGVRDRVPAIVHADGTARAQIVHKDEDPFLHAVLEHFAQHTGVPILINSSLNVRGKPIDESPHDALTSLYTSGLDYILMGSFLVDRLSRPM